MSKPGTDVPSAVTVASVWPLVPAWRVDRTFDYLVPDKLASKVAVGTLVRMPFGNRNVRGIVASLARSDPSDLVALKSVVIPHPLLPRPLDALYRWLAERYTTPRGVAFDRAVPPRVRVKVTGEPLPRGPAPDRLTCYENAEGLMSSLRSRDGSTWCLQTIPGEDRGRLIAEIVALASAGGQSLVAVPEVRYGSVVIDSILRIYPQGARVDSAAGDQERSAAWVSLAAGELRLGVGGRSTVLAPAPDLALVVLDEEDHRTYKEDRSPRYDARRVAVERARLQGATCVLLSSSPSLETGHGALTGRFGRVTPRRADARAARPIVELVEPPSAGLAPELHAAVRETLRKGERVGLLIPRAGYARALWCSSCRRSIRCPRCEAGVTSDRAQGTVTCPRCAWSAPLPELCPLCGAAELRSLGAGSERMAEQVARAFPRARVDRVDPGVLHREGPRSGRAEADIYITTWIGTKEVLRPDVSLVGVLDADGLIRRPDFRAAESAFQALWEMAEWAGPASSGGRLVIQTQEPGHHSIQAVARADYGFFLTRECAHREELGYPPFSELIKVRVSGKDAERWVDRVIATATGAGARALGPVPVRTPSGEALELLLKCPEAASVARDLRVILPDVPSGTRVRVDVDPR